MKRLLPILVLLITGCTTTELQTAATIAKPIADAALIAAAAHYGVPPSASVAAIAAFDQLWGMAAQAQAGQPVTQGASIAGVGTAVAKQLPATATPAQQVALLTAAAQLIPKK